MSTQTGTVKWFDDGKGFGFITPEGANAGNRCGATQDVQAGCVL